MTFVPALLRSPLRTPLRTMLTGLAFAAALAFVGTSAAAAQGGGASVQATASATIQNGATLDDGAFRYIKDDAAYIVPQTTNSSCKAADRNGKQPCMMILTELN